MVDFRWLPSIAVVMFGLGILLPIQAHAIDLTGAWATELDLCGRVFTKKGNQIVFTELSDLYGSGFIIQGNHIRGKSAQCTITSRKEDGATLQLFTACATTIMRSNVQFNLKVVDDNKIIRMFPDMPGMSLTYSRCTL